MKYFILVLIAALALYYVRVQSNDLAKVMYNEGCEDAALKLAISGLPNEASFIYKFCTERKKALDLYMTPF